MHDPRVGRFFTTDPLESKFPYYSAYGFSGNRVIDHIELEGGEDIPWWEGKTFSSNLDSALRPSDVGMVEGLTFTQMYQIANAFRWQTVSTTVDQVVYFGSTAISSANKIRDYALGEIFFGDKYILYKPTKIYGFSIWKKGGLFVEHEYYSDSHLNLSNGVRLFGGYLTLLSGVQGLMSSTTRSTATTAVSSIADDAIINTADDLIINSADDVVKNSIDDAVVNTVDNATVSGLKGHTTPWSKMSDAQRRAFQHSYRKADELGLPNWQQTKAESLQSLFNEKVTSIRNAGSDGFFKSKELVNGVRTTVNRTEPVINGQKYYYYETLEGKFVSAGRM